MTSDLSSARDDVLSTRRSAAEFMRGSVAACGTPAALNAFISTSFESAQAVAASIDTTSAAGAPVPPLAGLAVSIKDLFDVAGQVSAAGSRVLARAPAAATDAPAVARLRRAGAAFIARTNMSEFAFSGVGINPHHGTPANAATKARDTSPRIPGGSTSGGAVSVACGAAWAALGSDTGGSIRIPAALQGLVGFKNTARLTPTAGAIPLSTSLDTVSAITLSVRDAVLLHEILADRKVVLNGTPLRLLRLAVPRGFLLDALDTTVAAAFERSLSSLRQAGARVDEIDLAALGEVSALMAGGGFAPVESWAWHRKLISRDEARYDPRVAMRIRRGERMGAAEYIELQQARARWIEGMRAAMRHYDAMLSPTVPIVAPAIAPLLDDDDAFFATNSLLLRNPSTVNLLDGCAISLPCQRSDEFPVGLMVWSTALQDDTVLNAALAIESALNSHPR